MGVTSRAQRKEELCLKHPAVGVTFLGSVTRAFALPNIHWCMKFLSSRGHEAEGGAGCPTELALSSNCWQGLWRVLEKSVDPVRVCIGNE